MLEIKTKFKSISAEEFVELFNNKNEFKYNIRKIYIGIDDRMAQERGVEFGGDGIIGKFKHTVEENSIGKLFISVEEGTFLILNVQDQLEIDTPISINIKYLQEIEISYIKKEKNQLKEEVIYIDQEVLDVIDWN